MGFLVSMPSDYGLELVRDNRLLLRSVGLYEEALVQAFMGSRTNNAAWSVGALECLISTTDPDRLEALRPVPRGESFRVYRGVAGRKGSRRVRGLSWTGSVECAAWFAIRSAELAEAGSDPAVYAALVSRDDVWWHEADRNEDEYVVRPRNPQRLRLSVEELRVMAGRHMGATRKNDAALTSEAATKGR